LYVTAASICGCPTVNAAANALRSGHRNVPVEETNSKHIGEYARELAPKVSETGDNDEEATEAANRPKDGPVGVIDVNAVAK